MQLPPSHAASKGEDIEIKEEPADDLVGSAQLKPHLSSNPQMHRADSPWPSTWSPFPTQADDRSLDFPPGMKTPESTLLFRIKQRMAGMDPLNASSAFNAAWAPGAFGSPNLVEDASALTHVRVHPLCYCGFLV